MTQHPPGLLLAGKIGKPHGLGGEVYVVPISDDPARFQAGSRVVHADGRELQVEGSRSHRNRLLVKFAGVDSRDTAAELRGAVYARTEDARDLADDEYWVHDIVGCRVELRDGSAVGEVSRVVPGAAHDLLVVETCQGERMVPVVKEIVVGVRADEGRVVIDPPEGLLE